MNEKDYTLPDGVTLSADFDSLASEQQRELLKVIQQLKSKRGD